MKRSNLSLSFTAVILVGTAAASAAPTSRRMPLAPLSREQMRAAGIGGTGCFWMAARGGPVRMGMADERAAVSVDGRVVVLSPARGARDLFPFTYDKWTTSHGDLQIVVANVGPSRSEGAELLTSGADLILVRAGRRTVLHGQMACGS